MTYYYCISLSLIIIMFSFKLVYPCMFVVVVFTCDDHMPYVICEQIMLHMMIVQMHSNEELKYCFINVFYFILIIFLKNFNY